MTTEPTLADVLVQLKRLEDRMDAGFLGVRVEILEVRNRVGELTERVADNRAWLNEMFNHLAEHQQQGH